jgi:pyrroline-5-carboxylate reductase
MLNSKTIGFIGAGMMAEAIARGLMAASVDPSCMQAADPVEDRCDYFASELGVKSCVDNRSVAESSDILIIATKPHIVDQALAEIGSLLKPEQLVISIAAGTTLESIQSRLSADVPVVRVMPNTPALIGMGATAIAPGKYAYAEHLDLAAEIFGSVGKVVRVTEDKLDAVTGLSGSGPAFVYTFIEALADGGVRMGLPKSTALILAAQTVAGAAEMVLETGDHPAQLRDRVMTPGGTTIAGMASLERCAFRSALIEAVTVATERSAEMSKPHKS